LVHPCYNLVDFEVAVRIAVAAVHTAVPGNIAAVASVAGILVAAEVAFVADRTVAATVGSFVEVVGQPEVD